MLTLREAFTLGYLPAAMGAYWNGVALLVRISEQPEEPRLRVRLKKCEAALREQDSFGRVQAWILVLGVLVVAISVANASWRAPEDLALKPAFWAAGKAAVERLAAVLPVALATHWALGAATLRPSHSLAPTSTMTALLSRLGALLSRTHQLHPDWSNQQVEQFVRDSRINMIYEGTNTIQSLDLLGRKVLGNQGATLKKLGAIMEEFAESCENDEAMQEFIGPMLKAAELWSTLTFEIGSQAMKNPEVVGAAAVDYMRVAGHTVFAFWFAKMAKIALAKKDSGDPFYAAKLQTARFYFAKLLPEIESCAITARAGLKPLMETELALA